MMVSVALIVSEECETLIPEPAVKYLGEAPFKYIWQLSLHFYLHLYIIGILSFYLLCNRTPAVCQALWRDQGPPTLKDITVQKERQTNKSTSK